MLDNFFQLITFFFKQNCTIDYKTQIYSCSTATCKTGLGGWCLICLHIRFTLSKRQLLKAFCNKMINGAQAVLLWADDQMCHMPQWFVNIHECQLKFFFILCTADAISWDNWCTSNLLFKWQNIWLLIYLMNCWCGICFPWNYMCVKIHIYLCKTIDLSKKLVGFVSNCLLVYFWSFI